MKLKKFIAGVLTLAVTVTTLPQIYADRKAVFAEETTAVVVDEEHSQAVSADSDYEYTELEDGTLSITKYKGAGGDVVIPSEISGKKVTEISDYAFSNCTSLTSVEIPNSVTEIGWSVFSGCTSLISVEIPSIVTKLSSFVFCGCTSLALVEIPNSVIEIGDDAFFGCTSLKSVEIPNSVTKIGAFAFSDCTSLISVIISDSVTDIDKYAFSDCNSLLSINVDEKNVNYSSQNGILFNKAKTTLIYRPFQRIHIDSQKACPQRYFGRYQR